MKVLHRALVATLLAYLAVPAAADPPQTGVIDGQVVDAAGSALAGLAVALTGDRGERSTVTDDGGRFLFALLPSGTYTLRVVVGGFEPLETSVRLETGQRRTVELELGLDAAESIAVVAESPLVNRRQSSATTTVTGAVARELVFANRNYQAVLASLPGVVNGDVSANLAELTPSVNGGLWQENAAFVDGVDTTNARWGGSSRIVLPTSALAEIRTEAAAWGVEYGRVVGGVTSVVTKSGTNTLHGELLYVAQNQAWEAQSDAAPVDRENDVVSGYELSAGGPLVRDRAWFFVAVGDGSTNQLSRLAGGEVLDSSIVSQSFIGKLSFTPSSRHQLSLTGIDTPATVPSILPVMAERAAVSELDLGGNFITASWSFSAAANRFVEARVAHQTSSEDRTPIASTAVVPGASPDDPAGNQSAYWDGASSLRWHASGLSLGPGSLDYPRDQGNVALDWFVDHGELALGGDYQRVSFESLNQPPDRYLGSGYDPNRPGGFRAPELKRVFLPIDNPVETGSTNFAAFARDTIEIGPRFILNLGLRLEHQAQDDDRGREVLSSTDLTPRAALVYDVGANGRLLIKGTAGRYVTHLPQELVNAELAALPNGGNAWDEYRFNPATLRYDLFNRRQVPSGNTRVEELEPYTKDEVTAGIEWQASPAWSVDARVIGWGIERPFSATDQFDERGGVYRLVTGFEQAERKYRALQIEVDRALGEGLVVRANYTLSRVEGNSSGNTDFSHADDDFLEAMSVLDAATGLPVTAIHRYGRLTHDRPHILNVTGAKSFVVGASQRFTVGGWLSYRSGRPWGLRETVGLRTAAGPATIVTTRFSEARDAHELTDTYALNLTGAWELPIAGRWSGSLRAEVANVTDEQEQIAVNPITGRPIPVRASYQKPRELRLVVGLRF